MSTTDDPRPDSMKREMAQAFDMYEADYRDADWCSVVAEDSQTVIIADHKGYEFDEWQTEFGDGFSKLMHDLARSACDYDWCASYPIVFDKLE